MKSYQRFQEFHNESIIWVTLSRFLFLLGISVWLGSLVFLAYGVAPVNFKIAEEWSLEGTNPQHPEQNVNYRTIGGAFTAVSISRLATIELLGIILATLGLFLAWMPQHNRNFLLFAKTTGLALMVLIFMIYTQKFGARMEEIRAASTLDFSITDEALKPAEHLEFDDLHRRYTLFASINVVMCVFQLLLMSINPLASQKPLEGDENL